MRSTSENHIGHLETLLQLHRLGNLFGGLSAHGPVALGPTLVHNSLVSFLLVALIAVCVSCRVNCLLQALTPSLENCLACDLHFPRLLARAAHS